MNIVLNDKIDYMNDNLLYQSVKGGLGNQLAALLNIITLSSQYQKKYILHFYKKKSYSFYKNIQFSNVLEDSSTFSKFKEKNHIFRKIKLNTNENILLKGYFISYKYWWGYQDEIRNNLYIDYYKIDEIEKLFGDEKIIIIHIRLGDYLDHPDLFPISPIDYYKKALSFYNVEEYRIFLISDDISKAKEMLHPLQINYETTNFDDEHDFYMLLLSDVRICSNSTFSLMSCYLNEIYKFKPKAEYIFPSNWYNKNVFNYKLSDFMINHRFITIDTNNISFHQLYDVITILHEKDLPIYQKHVSFNKKFLEKSSDFYYVAKKEYDIESNFINEDIFPFSNKNVKNYLKGVIPSNRCGWYFQQLLKLYIFRTSCKLKPYILILDADIIFIEFISLFDPQPKIHFIDKKIHEPYVSTINYLFPMLPIKKKMSGVCHHMVFKKDIVEEILRNIEKRFKKPAWKAILDSVKHYVTHNGYNISILSEYEIYFHFVKKYKKNQYIIKKFDQFIDTNIKNMNWIDKPKLKFIGNHSWKRK